MSEPDTALQERIEVTENLYERDGYAWSLREAALLRARRFDDIDLASVIEEIESVGRSERSELLNRLIVLLSHLLTWRYQADRRGRSWRATISEQRQATLDHLADNPSLKSQLGDLLVAAYRRGRLRAVAETDLPLSTFPAECPWTFASATDDDFWPDAG